METDIEIRCREIIDREFNTNLEAILKSNGTDKEAVRQMSMFLAVVRIEHPSEHKKYLEDYCESVMHLDHAATLEIAQSIAKEYKR